MDDINQNIEKHSPNKNRKILIVFDSNILNMLSNKKNNPLVTGGFIRRRKLNISLVFITLFYYENITNSTNRSSDIDFIDFMNRYKKTCHKTIFFFSD